MATQGTGTDNVIPFERAAITRTEATLGRTDQAFVLAERELARIAERGAAGGIDPRLSETMAAYVTLCGGLGSAQVRAAVRAEVARCLGNLVSSLAELGRHRVALAPARQVVAIRRELAAKAPDVHLPRLARALSDLAVVLSAVGERQEAHEMVEEAVRTLAIRVPASSATFAPWMITLEQNYRVRCREIETEPDIQLLAPMLEVLRRMQEGSGEQGPTDDGLDS